MLTCECTRFESHVTRQLCVLLVLARLDNADDSTSSNSELAHSETLDPGDPLQLELASSTFALFGLSSSRALSCNTRVLRLCGSGRALSRFFARETVGPLVIGALRFGEGASS